MHICQKIISGGQTGSDRAALDWAISHHMPHGGWCPKGRLAADGVLPDHYQLQETASTGYRQRTKRNIQDSDGTLIINRGELTGGTLLTKNLARQLGKPCYVVAPEQDRDDAMAAGVLQWLWTHRIRILNIAGPRESKQPGIYLDTRNILDFIQKFHTETHAH